MAYRNPIIPGFAPDPSIVRIRDTFYLVNSSFHLFPGLPIFASKDLIAWRHIGNAINRPTQLSLAHSGTKLNCGSGGGGDSGDKAPATGGLYAPSIRHYNGMTYIVCTNVLYDPGKDSGDWISGIDFQNFIISTPDIGVGQWSDPVYFDFHGIDPDLFFDDDDDGRAYISGSSWVPKPSCCISCFEIDVATGRKMTREHVLWDGYMQIIPEGPHVYKRDGYYYLLIAEGGTHDGHCISIARAPSIWGPYESCSANPILQPTGGRTDSSSFCHYNGHGDLVQDVHGEWWLVCLGVRRDRAGRMVLGRETFLASVDWQAEQPWPRIQQPIPYKLQRTLILPSPGECDEDASSRPSLGREMTPSPLSPKIDLVWIRDPDFSRCQVSQDSRVISLLPSRTDLGQCTAEPTAFVGRRVRRAKGLATVDLLLTQALTKTRETKTGLAYYKDEYRYARIMYDPRNQEMVFEVVNHAKDPPILITKRSKVSCGQSTRMQFRILYTEQLINFLCRVGDFDDGKGWVSHGLIDTLDMSGHDFTGPVVGVFATGGEEEWCTFDNVEI
ncbi:glycosyl hydrolase [Aspergillus heterothallicus]